MELPLYTYDEERNLKSLVYALTQYVSSDKHECDINYFVMPIEDEEVIQTNNWLKNLFRDSYLFNSPNNLVAAGEIMVSATKNNWICETARDNENFRTSIDDFVENVRERHAQTMLTMQKIVQERKSYYESIFSHSFHPVCYMTRNTGRIEDEAYVVLIGRKKEGDLSSWDQLGIVRSNGQDIRICPGDDLYNKAANDFGNPRLEIAEFLQ